MKYTNHIGWLSALILTFSPKRRDDDRASWVFGWSTYLSRKLGLNVEEIGGEGVPLCKMEICKKGPKIDKIKPDQTK